MICRLLPAIILASSAHAQTGGLCRNVPFSSDNCVRVLACIGDQGLIYDGNARGWDNGTIRGTRSDGVDCNGTWTADGPLGSGVATVTCTDETTIGVVYYTQDNVTGTVTGRGADSLGRAVEVWTGENVLQFLTGPDAFGPALPCVQGDIPIS